MFGNPLITSEMFGNPLTPLHILINFVIEIHSDSVFWLENDKNTSDIQAVVFQKYS